METLLGFIYNFYSHTAFFVQKKNQYNFARIIMTDSIIFLYFFFSGEKQAAMQSGSVSTIFSQSTPSILALLFVAICQVLLYSPELSSTIIITHILSSDRVFITSNNIIKRINLLLSTSSSSSSSSSLSATANSTTCGRRLSSCYCKSDRDTDMTTKTTGERLLAHNRKGEQITNLL